MRPISILPSSPTRSMSRCGCQDLKLDILIGVIAQAHTAPSDLKNPPISKVTPMINVSTPTREPTVSWVVLHRFVPNTNGLEHGVLTFAKRVRKVLPTLQNVDVVRGYASAIADTERDAVYRGRRAKRSGLSTTGPSPPARHTSSITFHLVLNIRAERCTLPSHIWCPFRQTRRGCLPGGIFQSRCYLKFCSSFPRKRRTR